jgi:hypothetical protein
MSLVTLYLFFAYACGAAAIVDALRRPQAQWVAADRNRSWWAGTMIVCTLFGLGPVIGLIYLLAVAPGFSREQRYDTGGFEKRR